MIKCIFFAEFDNDIGPKLSYQSPEGFLSQDTFESVAEYVIVKHHLCGRLVSLNAFMHRHNQRYKIMGFPIKIDSPKYHRNYMLFNCAFVFGPDASVDRETEAFERVLRKLALTLQTLETECSFLYCKHTRERLPIILAKIRDGLNTHGECVIYVDEANTINLKLFHKTSSITIPVAPHHVPVKICDLEPLEQSDCDLTLRKIIPYIDGVRYVKRISDDADVDLSLTQKSIQHLIHYGLVTLVDAFQYSNRYTATPNIANLRLCQQQCVRFVTPQGRTPLPFSRIFALYCMLRPDLRMSDFCRKRAAELNRLDERMFIQFGLIHKFIRRVHMYPIRTYPRTLYAAAGDPAPTTDGDVHPFVSRLVEHGLLDGQHCMDELCCFLSVEHAILESTLRADRHCHFFFK
eukprot:gnl/Spiro4/16064_TR8634_c0_g1_i1.p1 gnl/Spiro4/16064_TR8634_c0_g1~~gnl/Spiro4/16064_TR8634_c0_g1_i1.p1  ORF type:complete len:405 (+),score=126.22 gnl/Spiro4/16064_TR8634_c0_g1_i1:72-1286(+)